MLHDPLLGTGGAVNTYIVLRQSRPQELFSGVYSTPKDLFSLTIDPHIHMDEKSKVVSLVVVLDIQLGSPVPTI